MRRSIFTSLSPNVEWDDVLLAVGVAFLPWYWRRGRAVKKLEKRIAKDFEMPEAVTFDSGRTSLTTLLETSGLAAGDEVALQAYTCVAVPNAVLWAGFKPLYIDCERRTLTMSPTDLEKKITPRTKAVVIQHTFGQTGNLSELLGVAHRHNLLVIEDCAHAIGGKYNGRLLGTWGDASFMSFGRDKVISGVFGGLALTRNLEWAKRLRKKQAEYPLPGYFWTWRQLIHPIVTFKVKLFYDFFDLGKIGFALVKKLRLVSRAVEPIERKAGRPAFVSHRLPNALALLAFHQYKKLDHLNKHRQEVAESYLSSLENYANCELSPYDKEVRPLRYLVRVDDPKKIIELAKKEKIYFGDWYDQPIAPAGVDYQKIGYQVGSCPVAEEAARTSLNLPTDIHIKTKERERILRFLQSYFAPQPWSLKK